MWMLQATNTVPLSETKYKMLQVLTADYKLPQCDPVCSKLHSAKNLDVRMIILVEIRDFKNNIQFIFKVQRFQMIYIYCM